MKRPALLNNYKTFKDGMILRDYLALDRTVLANERTFLAYLRTFIGVLSAGIALLKLLDNTPLILMTGYGFIIVSPLFLLFGVMRYVQTNEKLRTLSQEDET
jgi:putative membrane protein